MNNYTVGSLREVARIIEMVGYSRLNKSQLIEAILNEMQNATVKQLRKVAFFLYIPAYSILKKAELLKEIGHSLGDDGDTNRIEKARKKLSRNTSPSKAISILFGQLEPSTVIVPGCHYFYIYEAKTPGLLYDKYPLITCTGLTNKGWEGYQHHWHKSRQYTTPELRSNFYQVYDDELDDAIQYPCAEYIQN